MARGEILGCFACLVLFSVVGPALSQMSIINPWGHGPLKINNPGGAHRPQYRPPPPPQPRYQPQRAPPRGMPPTWNRAPPQPMRGGHYPQPHAAHGAHGAHAAHGPHAGHAPHAGHHAAHAGHRPTGIRGSAAVHPAAAPSTAAKKEPLEVEGPTTTPKPTPPPYHGYNRGGYHGAAHGAHGAHAGHARPAPGGGHHPPHGPAHPGQRWPAQRPPQNWGAARGAQQRRPSPTQYRRPQPAAKPPTQYQYRRTQTGTPTRQNVGYQYRRPQTRPPTPTRQMPNNYQQQKRPNGQFFYPKLPANPTNPRTPTYQRQRAGTYPTQNRPAIRNYPAQNRPGSRSYPGQNYRPPPNGGKPGTAQFASSVVHSVIQSILGSPGPKQAPRQRGPPLPSQARSSYYNPYAVRPTTTPIPTTTPAGEVELEMEGPTTTPAPTTLKPMVAWPRRQPSPTAWSNTWMRQVQPPRQPHMHARPPPPQHRPNQHHGGYPAPHRPQPAQPRPQGYGQPHYPQHRPQQPPRGHPPQHHHHGAGGHAAHVAPMAPQDPLSKYDVFSNNFDMNAFHQQFFQETTPSMLAALANAGGGAGAGGTGDFSMSSWAQSLVNGLSFMTTTTPLPPTTTPNHKVHVNPFRHGGLFLADPNKKPVQKPATQIIELQKMDVNNGVTVNPMMSFLGKTIAPAAKKTTPLPGQDGNIFSGFMGFHTSDSQTTPPPKEVANQIQNKFNKFFLPVPDHNSGGNVNPMAGMTQGGGGNRPPNRNADAQQLDQMLKDPQYKKAACQILRLAC